MIFLQFRSFRRNCWILCWPEFPALYQNEFPVHWQTGSAKKTQRCMGAESWHCKQRIPDWLSVRCLHGYAHGNLQMTRRFCFHSMMFQCSCAACNRQSAGTLHFPPISTHRIIFTSAVVQTDAFRISSAEEKPAAPAPAFGERDNGVNYSSFP